MADKPIDSKKKADVHGDENLSDSDCSVPDIECETCSMSFTSPKNYAAHVKSKKHLQKVAEAKFKVKNEASDGKIREQNGSDSEENSDEDSEQMHCDVCDKYFTGYISYASHIKGSLHTKNMKKEKLKQQLKDMPEVLHGEDDSDDDDLIHKPYAKCSTCMKQFSGPESFKMHMKSAGHLKKVKQSGALEKLKSELPEGSDDEEEFYKKCDTCKKSFSGIVPYKTHMLSNVHKKNLQRKKVAEELKEFCDNEDGYICKECKKSFTDPLAFKSHLENNSHEKLKAKEALKEFLNAHPEIQFVIPYSREGEDDEDEDEEDSKYYLICKLCHVSFTGLEPAQDHVKSKKHLSAKKEKKMLKLLEEQKKNSTKSDTKNSKTDENSSASANTKSAENKSKNGHVYSVDDFEMI